MAIIDDIAAISQNKQLLLTAREPVKELIFFALGDHTFDLPSGALSPEELGDIPSNNDPRGDILAVESKSLVRIFVAGHVFALDRQKRILIFRQILARCNRFERDLLLSIVRHRTLPGINRQDVLAAYGNGWLDARPLPPAPSPPVAPVKPRSGKRNYEPFRPLKDLGYQV